MRSRDAGLRYAILAPSVNLSLNPASFEFTCRGLRSAAPNKAGSAWSVVNIAIGSSVARRATKRSMEWVGVVALFSAISWVVRSRAVVVAATLRRLHRFRRNSERDPRIERAAAPTAMPAAISGWRNTSRCWLLAPLRVTMCGVGPILRTALNTY